MIQDHRLPLKEAVISYLGEVPVYKWAAKAVKKNQDTIKDWRKEDPDFNDQCEAKISEFVRRTVKRAKPEFQLERLLRNDFSQRTEVTGADGEDLTIKVISYSEVKNAENNSI